MPIIKNNQLVSGASGNFGKQFVYKTRGGKTYIARMPVFNKDAPPTEKQAKMRDLFSSAALFAKGVISSPDLKKEYQKKAIGRNTAYNVAFRDYLRPPVVKGIELEKYTGSPGSSIIISAKDEFRVVEVTVSIRSGAGVLVEEGNAILNPFDRNKWIYTAVQNNAAPTGSIVRATAKDIPGNVGSLI